MTPQDSIRDSLHDPARTGRPIVFFDGVCGLCNRCVDFLLRIDRKKALVFAPLQGETARAVLPPPPADSARWSMVYLDERGAHEQSEGALRICRRVGGIWRVFSVGLLMPRALRDAVYRFIARRRYRWFGKRETCRIPTAEERGRFLP